LKLSVLPLCISLSLSIAGLGCGALDGDEGSLPASSPHSERGGIGLNQATQAVVSPSQVINARRSLAVTEQTITSQFTLSAVMNQLAAQNGNGAFTGTQLFRQLWETQNAVAGPFDLQPSAHCSDNGTSLNGFPNVCRNLEGAQANAGNGTNIGSYSAVGLFNRFDLAPNTATNCGEYRIVFAKTSGGSGRTFIIFEATLPNPRQDLGLEGCRPVQAFWRDLSNVADINTRATLLRDFYFTGLPGFAPVIHMENYGFNSFGSGQIRVNMFMADPWTLKEFKLARQCPLGVCELKALPVSVKANPFGDLFNPGSTNALAGAFQAHFISQVQTLSLADVNRFTYDVPDQFNAASSDSQSGGVVDDYVANLGGASAFRDGIQAALDTIGSALSPDEIVARAQSLSCGGCHQRSFGANLGGGLQGPISAGFVHATEITEAGPDGTRFQLSFSLTNTFLPFRKGVVEEFLSAAHPVSAITRFDMAGSAVDAKSVYWVENRASGSVMKASLNSGGEQVLAFNRANPIAIATDGVSVFWAESSGSIFKMPVGGGSITTLATGINGLGGVATDGANVFWTQNGTTIARKSVNGGSTTNVITGRTGMSGRLAVDGSSLFWQEGSNIQKRGKSGGSISTLINRGSITGIATDGTNVYLAENTFPGNVLRVPVGGGPVTSLFPGFFLTSVAVGATNVVWTSNMNPGPVMTKVKD
jgi:hypothetical protein